MLLFELACTGPGPESGDSQPAEVLDCALGMPSAEGWVPVEDKLELTMGFQGFLLIVLQAQTPLEGPALMEVAYAMEVQGGEPISGTQPRVPMIPGETNRTSDEILVFLTSHYPSWYEGRQAHLVLKLTDKDHACTLEAEGILVEEDPCSYEGGMPDCPEDSGR